MKDIRGHRSYTKEEIVEILCRTGTYTCPTLPHYRYDGVKRICGELRKRGFLRKTGNTNEGVNLAITERFREWKSEKESGLTTSGPVKWQKEKYPLPAPKKKESAA